MKHRLLLTFAVLAFAVLAGAVGIVATARPTHSGGSGDDLVAVAAAEPSPSPPRDEARPLATSTTTTSKPTPPSPPPSPPSTTKPKPAPLAQAPRTGGAEAFRQCVFLRESGNNYHVGFAGGYGILTATWHSLGYSGQAGDASPAQQDEAFWRLFAKYGTRPWQPYDGCHL